MKRTLVSLLLCLSLCLVPAAGTAFTDIDQPDVAAAAAALQGLGVVSGTAQDTFSPDDTLTRAQMCAMAVNAAGLSGQVGSYARKTLFSDVPSGSWYNGYVNLCYSLSYISGNGDGTFSPDAAITYGQIATILLKMLGYTSTEIGSVWPLDYTNLCDQLELSQGLDLSPYDTVTRGEAALLFYRAMSATLNGSQQPYYTGISGVSSSQEVILLDVDASYGGGAKLMAYALDGDGLTYYSLSRSQSETLEGYMGVLLLDAGGQVLGFLPQEAGWEDLVISEASASTLTDVHGESHRISSGAVVISGGETYPYSTSGYLQLSAQAGKTVRLYYSDDGAVTCLYLSGGTSSASQAAVAQSSSAERSLARALGISDKTYTITKNGVSADGEDLAMYDVAYYDSASATLRACDYRVTGYLSSASPSVTAAETVTLAGCSFSVLECAWDTLGEVSLGEKITLLLTDDGKVAAAYPASTLSADMVGVLSEDGKSVTLTGSGVTLSAETMDYEYSAPGSLVSVTAASSSKLRCTLVSAASGALDLEEHTLDSASLAPACTVYEWTGTGYVYDLEGNRGSGSSDLSAITWTDSIPASSVSYYHTNSAGQVDVILLNDVTGSCYDYGELNIYSGEYGINMGSGSLPAYNQAATLTNSGGVSEKYLCTIFASGNQYAGISLSPSSYAYTQVTEVRALEALEGVTRDDFFLEDGTWYVTADGEEYPVSSQVQIHLTGSDLWLGGSDGLESTLADGYSLTLYCDRSPSQGGQIRVIAAH